MKNDLVYIRHIIEAIEKIEKYLGGITTVEVFVVNDLVFDAVVRELEIVGEASNKVSVEFQNTHTQIPWRKMIGLRNVLIHEYFGINAKVVWETCQNDIQEVKKALISLDELQ
jgi:uncharacterized protein with HEPN domain